MAANAQTLFAHPLYIHPNISSSPETLRPRGGPLSFTIIPGHLLVAVRTCLFLHTLSFRYNGLVLMLALSQQL